MTKREPQVGDLAIVCGTATGDSPWVRKLYASRNPILIIDDLGEVVAVLHEERKKYINKHKLEVVSEGR
tara:strand:- start:529 stop:735 length:207 start_codon:yes stop_codon:yes gene_type:complete